jgi:hypothetical protein
MGSEAISHLPRVSRSSTGTGINSAGALQAFGTSANALGGVITLAAAASIGANVGATLNIVRGLTGAQALTFAGPGTINVQNALWRHSE